jgi:hypothetical protein
MTMSNLYKIPVTLTESEYESLLESRKEQRESEAETKQEEALKRLALSGEENRNEIRTRRNY